MQLKGHVHESGRAGHGHAPHSLLSGGLARGRGRGEAAEARGLQSHDRAPSPSRQGLTHQVSGLDLLGLALGAMRGVAVTLPEGQALLTPTLTPKHTPVQTSVPTPTHTSVLTPVLTPTLTPVHTPMYTPTHTPMLTLMLTPTLKPVLTPEDQPRSPEAMPSVLWFIQ